MSSLSERFTADQIQVLRAELTREIKKLEQSLETTRRAARPVKLDQTSVGRLSRIDAMQNQSMTQGLQERQQRKTAQFASALARMNEGSYGLCEGCGKPIGFERLMLFPETQTCVDCAS